MTESRAQRWIQINPKDPEASLVLLREIIRDYGRRLDALDLTGDSLSIPAGTITQTMLAADSVGSSQIIADAVGTSEIAPDAVTKAELSGGFLACKTVTGAAAGDVTVTGIATGDELVAVLRFNKDATASNIDMTTLTGEFTITGTDTINNAGGTSSAGDTLIVLWLDLT